MATNKEILIIFWRVIFSSKVTVFSIFQIVSSIIAPLHVAFLLCSSSSEVPYTEGEVGNRLSTSACRLPVIHQHTPHHTPQHTPQQHTPYYTPQQHTTPREQYHTPSAGAEFNSQYNSAFSNGIINEECPTNVLGNSVDLTKPNITRSGINDPVEFNNVKNVNRNNKNSNMHRQDCNEEYCLQTGFTSEDQEIHQLISQGSDTTSNIKNGEQRGSLELSHCRQQQQQHELHDPSENITNNGKFRRKKKFR